MKTHRPEVIKRAMRLRHNRKARELLESIIRHNYERDRAEFLTTGKLSREWYRAAFKEHQRQHINHVYADMLPAQMQVSA